MKVMLILILLANGQWEYHEVQAKSCERTAAVVARKLESKQEIQSAWASCITRYKA